MDAKDEVKQRLSIEDVVGDYLELKRAGRNMKARSPWTNEKTPSLMVSPEKQIWHDFSSSKGGDMFSFVMEVEGVDFRGALEILARKANVDLAQYSKGDGGTAKRKQRFYEAHELAIRYYQHTLFKNTSALEYLRKKRAYEKETIAQFCLGYAPADGVSFTRFMAKRGYSADELRQAGLATQRRGGLGDMFRGRIMVPLADGQGRAVGFTGRILDESIKNAPKYLNTPQTLIYDKSRNVFGLHLAKAAIRQNDCVVIVEGNMDVVASHQVGVAHVVATAGTAMTEYHIKQLSRLTPNIKLAFDSDAAGIAATERAIELIQGQDVNLSIVTIQDGKDPDELIKHDPDAWRSVVDSSDYVMDWLLEHYQKQFDVTTAQGKTKLTSHVLQVLARLRDPVEQEYYAKRLAAIADVSLGAIEQKRAQFASRQPGKQYKKTNIVKKETTDHESAYKDSLLAVNLVYPESRPSLENVVSEQFDAPRQQQMLHFIESLGGQGFDGNLPQELHSIEDYVKILLLKAEELYGSWSSTDRTIEAIGLARRLSRENMQKAKQRLTHAIADAEQRGDENEASQLLNQYHKLLKEV